MRDEKKLPLTHYSSLITCYCFYTHSHSVFRSERDDRQSFDRMIRDEAHPPALCECGDEQDAFHPREAFADAASRAATKRKVSELRSCFTHCGRPAFRVEAH